MKKQLKLFLVFATLVLFGVFAWRTEIVHTYVIDPTARILWLFYRTLRSIDQEIYWFLLIFSVLLLIFRVLPESKEFSTRPAYENPNQNQDRILFWETLINAAETDQYDRLRLQRSLQTLSQSIGDISCNNEDSIIHLPLIKTGFRRWIQQTSYSMPIPRFVQRKKTQSDTELEKSIAQTLNAMERQIEINHD
ncbi:MAG: hypothetical protein IT308_03930 [Anaerolineaceae bacterium]|nr:hypothetical protein [Anaerolineaceae bacterium]